ncbi:MAG: hypothetical protein NTX61_04355 [Bacteroidetes bacterium]|nr:hypothetical protein [Bacteroidota bacterium]
MKRKIIFICSIFILSGIMLGSCKKEPGTGGNSTIYGKVFVKDYNSSFTVLQEEYYGPDIWVYIIYGDDRDYGDRIITSYDGTYEFKYLRKGTYHIYAFSKDSTLQTAAPVAVMKDEVISKNNETIQVPDLIIFN